MDVMDYVKYEDLKRMFEKNVCCIFFDNIEHFVSKASDTVCNTKVLSRNEFKKRYMFLQCIDGDSTCQFIVKWLDDENRTTVVDITCEPTLISNMSFNLWQPFQARNAVRLNDSRKSLNIILAYMKKLFGEEGSQTVLAFFAKTLKHAGIRLDYALAIVGGCWYERTAIVHFFSHSIIGPYLAQRLVPTTTQNYAGLKLVWIDSHYYRGEHEPILDTNVVQAGRVPVWGLRNITNIIVTCEEFLPSDSLRTVQAANITLPSNFTCALRDEGSPRAFHDYLLYEH